MRASRRSRFGRHVSVSPSLRSDSQNAYNGRSSASSSVSAFREANGSPPSLTKIRLRRPVSASAVRQISESLLRGPQSKAARSSSNSTSQQLPLSPWSLGLTPRSRQELHPGERSREHALARTEKSRSSSVPSPSFSQSVNKLLRPLSAAAVPKLSLFGSDSALSSTLSHSTLQNHPQHHQQEQQHLALSPPSEQSQPPPPSPPQPSAELADEISPSSGAELPPPATRGHRGRHNQTLHAIKVAVLLLAIGLAILIKIAFVTCKVTVAFYRVVLQVANKFYVQTFAGLRYIHSHWRGHLRRVLIMADRFEERARERTIQRSQIMVQTSDISQATATSEEFESARTHPTESFDGDVRSIHRSQVSYNCNHHGGLQWPEGQAMNPSTIRSKTFVVSAMRERELAVPS